MRLSTLWRLRFCASTSRNNLTKMSEYTDENFVPEKNRYAETLSEFIKCKTISDERFFDKTEFDKFLSFIKGRFPLVFEKGEYKDFNGGIMIKIDGKSHDEPLVLMSHYDVVRRMVGQSRKRRRLRTRRGRYERQPCRDFRKRRKPFERRVRVFKRFIYYFVFARRDCRRRRPGHGEVSCRQRRETQTRHRRRRRHCRSARARRFGEVRDDRYD